MFESLVPITLIIFVLTVLFMIWKPFGINETIPTAIGAFLLIILGIVSIGDLFNILTIVSGPSFTILSTIVMSIVLESVGFFRWVAMNIVRKANGSGRRLFIFVICLCYLTTLFFNNDGSILITTPILINVVNQLKLKPHQKIPYLMSGALVATASSAPIAVSNLANLIALKIVGLDLNTYVQMLFVPSMVGIISMVGLLYFYYRKDMPKKILKYPDHFYLDEPKKHPLASGPNIETDWKMFRWAIVIVILTRCGYFILTPFNVPIEVIAIIGAVLLLVLRWKRQRKGPKDVVKRTPWHILLFAFSMYVIVFGLQNIGMTTFIVNLINEPIASNHFNAIFLMGTLLTVLSNLVNNLPSVMIGTLALTHMDINSLTLHLAYLANIVGSDIGSLLTPVGTLAALFWMYILRKNHIPFTWGQYIKVTFMVIPITVVISLLAFYFWTEWLFY